MTSNEAQKLLAKHGTLTKAAQAAGMVRSPGEFRALYDLNTIVPKKIEAGLKQVGKSWNRIKGEFVAVYV